MDSPHRRCDKQFVPTFDNAVERPKKAALCALPVMTQQDRGQRRRQRQRIESGNRNGKCDRQCELPEKNSGRARKECHRHEHRHQHQRRRDHRPGDFLHRHRRGVMRLRDAFDDMPFDIFNDHDRVVNDQTRWPA